MVIEAEEKPGSMKAMPVKIEGRVKVVPALLRSPPRD